MLHLRSETVTVRIRMNMVLDDYDGQMIPEEEYDLNFQTFVLRMREHHEKNLNQETNPTGDRTQVRLMRGNDVTPRRQRWSPLF